MSILQKYFGLCTICNVIMVGLVLMISSQHILNNTLSNIIIFFAFINMLKVINQFRILKSLGDGINNMVSLISDRIFDFIKFVIYTIIIVSFQSFCITELATYIFVTICVSVNGLPKSSSNKYVLVLCLLMYVLILLIACSFTIG